MKLYNRLLPDIPMASAATILRISLGLVLCVGGWKLAFPADPAALLQSYHNPDSGFIAPFLVEWIEQFLGLEMLTFLQLLGWMKVTAGIALVVGFCTPWSATLAGLLFLSFPIASPTPGMIRLAPDITMGGFAFALAFTGSGRLSIDEQTGWFPVILSERRPWFFGMIRVALLYTFIMALLFPFGIGANSLNQTLPWTIVLILTVALVPLNTDRLACWVIAFWMAIIVIFYLGDTVFAEGVSGLYWGLDAAKRELGILGGSLAYALAGQNEISLIPPGNFKKQQ